MSPSDITSKNIDGITDLVVVAPIRDDFIEAYENVTYASRLKLVAEALNRIRVSAREHERVTPFSDVTERILTLLDFRVGIIDKDLFQFAPEPDAGGLELQSRRYLYLTATFDGAWEPYMRLIWKPLGPFLDLFFQNCEGYVTATDHSFAEYSQWVRDNQVDSAIFYATSGVTVRDTIHLANLERMQRAGCSPLALAETMMPDPEKLATATRADPLAFRKAVQLGLEALTVLYKLADYYPPEWLTKYSEMSEGRLLAKVAVDLLSGWDGLVAKLDTYPPGSAEGDRWQKTKKVYREPLQWYDSGKRYLAELDGRRTRAKDPVFERGQVQGGILKPQGSLNAKVRQGALLLFTVRDAAGAREFMASADIHYEDADRRGAGDGFFRTVGLTANGLERLGLAPGVIDHFPKEFRDGMAARGGLIGDMRENHPRNWILPQRNGPGLLGDIDVEAALPPIEPDEIDFVVQIRTTYSSVEVLIEEIRALACAAAPGATLEGYELMEVDYAEDGTFIDAFGFHDGVSQPRPDLPDDRQGGRDRVAAGEILLGYGNDREDDAPVNFKSFPLWRQRQRRKALALQKNGTYLVVRKIEQRVAAFEQFLENACVSINATHPDLLLPMDPNRLKARILGRWPDGRPLLPTGGGGANDFDYETDPTGRACPLAAHIRRANPRDEFQKRPAPRLLRRGMSFDHRDGNGQGAQGLMFLAYSASIAEQYETIQRWLNGGNSTHVASADNDPLTGVRPKSEGGAYRFLEEAHSGTAVIIVPLPGVAHEGTNEEAEPGRHPFAPLHWGLYLFVPSRDAIAALAALSGRYNPMREALEQKGLSVIERLWPLDRGGAQLGKEWKRLLEDFTVKDPAERNISPEMWSAIRYYMGGALNLRTSLPFLDYDWQNPDRKTQNVILCASPRVNGQVLADWRIFSTEEQLRRIAGNAGPIFVAQQPDNRYRNNDLASLGLDYAKESVATNGILFAFGEEEGFAAGYAAGTAVLAMAKEAAADNGLDFFKIELRRQFIMPALGGLCQILYGLPDGQFMKLAGWAWDPIDPEGGGAGREPHCPGDFISPSRNAFYPRPSKTVERFAGDHGRGILEASVGFVKEHRERDNGTHAGIIASRMFAAIDDDEVLARNLVGTMTGAIPPMDGHLRGILLEWLNERSLWRHQSALRRRLGGRAASADIAAALDALRTPVSQAMCKRPAPDLLYRTATEDALIPLTPKQSGIHTVPSAIEVKTGDLLVVSLVSAAQRSLREIEDGDPTILFGGRRKAPSQSCPEDHEHPVHACPAQKLATGAMMGILAALLDCGRIQALPASLIVSVSEFSAAA